MTKSVSYIDASELGGSSVGQNWLDFIDDASWGDNDITLISVERVREAVREAGQERALTHVLDAAYARGVRYVNLEG